MHDDLELLDLWIVGVVSPRFACPATRPVSSEAALLSQRAPARLGIEISNAGTATIGLRGRLFSLRGLPQRRPVPPVRGASQQLIGLPALLERLDDGNL